MKATKINIAGSSFLLPEAENYTFPTYIVRHKDAISAHVEAGRKFAADPLSSHFEGLPDVSEFKKITGIIGFPFSAHDPDLYALDKGFEVVLEVDL